MNVHENILKIARIFNEYNIKSYLVGGIVRDSLLNIISDDIDICLVGVKDINIITKILKENSNNVAEQVGEKFPVWIADIEGVGKVDFALARSEKKRWFNKKRFFYKY